MNKTGAGLCDYAISKIGTPYFYGAKMQTLTESFMSKMHEMYPSTVSITYIRKARSKGMVGKTCVDCSGLIGTYREKNIGSAQLYSIAKKRMPISEIDNFAVGTVLWKNGHVGIYIGKENGIPMCVEAKGIDYGVEKTKVADTKWMYGLTFNDMEYSYAITVGGNKKDINPYKEPTENIKRGSRGDGAKWVQWELNEAGYNLVVDGIFGLQSHNALVKFQKSCKITQDGICGAKTRGFLKAN